MEDKKRARILAKAGRVLWILEACSARMRDREAAGTPITDEEKEQMYEEGVAYLRE